MSIEKLKNKAEQSWVGCDGCNQDDKQMWINGYLSGALSNQIKLPSEDEIEIPIDAHSFEVFAIKDCEESPTGKQAFIGFKISNGDFHFIGVPYTEPKQQDND